MKVTLGFAVAAVCISLTSADLSCFYDKDKCGEDECCARFGSTRYGRCMKIVEEGEMCKVNVVKMLSRDHVYMWGCQCKQGLKCVPDDGFVGLVYGTCQSDSVEDPAKTEVPEEE